MKKQATIEDVLVVIQDLSQMMSERFDRLEERMDKLEKVSREHTAAIQELTDRVERLEGHFGGLDEDVKYLYKLIENFKKDMKAGLLSAEETRSRLEEVEAIARQLSLRVGLNH